MMLVILFALLLALITLGVPILLVMGIVGLFGILSDPGLVPALFPQKMFAMLDNFSLLALPYFILAGELVSAGGISKRLVWWDTGAPASAMHRWCRAWCLRASPARRWRIPPPSARSWCPP